MQSSGSIELNAAIVEQHLQEPEKLRLLFARTFSQPDVLVQSFVSEDASEDTLNIDFQQLEKIYFDIKSKEFDKDQDTVRSWYLAVNMCLSRLKSTHDYDNAEAMFSKYPTKTGLRILVNIFAFPFLESDPFSPIFEKLFSIIASLNSTSTAALARCWSNLSPDLIKHQVICVQQALTLCISQSMDEMGYSIHHDKKVERAVKTLKSLYEANNFRLPPKIHISEFVNDAINDSYDFETDARAFFSSQHQAISFANYPFLLTTQKKTRIMEIEGRVRQRPQNIFEALLGANHFVLRIDRNHVVRDAINQLSAALATDPSQLQKSLKVEFIGEEGVDEGGLRKEFFQLLLRELFDPKYGMFVYYDDHHVFWPRSTSLEAPQEFRLLGTVLGLAVINVIILDLHFPSAIYKKLMNVPVGIEELEEFQPDLVNGFRQMLIYEGDDFDDIFDRNFTMPVEAFGEIREEPIVPGGEEKRLTRENSQEFVDAYVNHFLNQSIRVQFDAFRDGFRAVVDNSRCFQMIDVAELETVLCGVPDLDFDALQSNAKYDGGYDSNHQIIKWFWDITKSFSESEKRKLLFFTTGTDRAPVGGLGTLRFIIVRQANSDRLPSAHTCFNVLMIPEYESREKLENLLRKAITHAEGFGML